MIKFDMLFLHGWGFKNTVFSEFVKAIENKGEALVPCLYALSEKHKDYTFDALSELISKKIKRPTIVVAWSIGGLLAHRLLKSSNQIIKTVFIASAPKMINDGGWNQTIEKDSFEKLKDGLSVDYDKTLNAFLGMVCFGDKSHKHLKQKLYPSLVGDKEANVLSAWLNEMEIDDQRELFSLNNKPALMLFGENDVLIKPGVIKQLQNLNAGIELQMIHGAGHVPFVSHLHETQQMINWFINDTKH